MKIHFNKVICMLALATGLTSCQNDELVAPAADSATLAFYTPVKIETRTMLENGKTVVWQEGDEIAVYDFSAPKHKFSATIMDGSAHFLGNITPRHGSFIAAYPYNLAAENSVSNNSILMQLPSQQTAMLGGFADDLNLSIAEGERHVDGSPSQVTFHNVCQLLKFNIPTYAADRIASIVLSTTSGIAGNMVVAFEDHDIVVTMDSGASNSITLKPQEGTTAFAEGTYYFVVAPTALESFTLTLTTLEGKTYSQSCSNNEIIEGRSGFIYNLGNLDLIDVPAATTKHVYVGGQLVGTNLSLTAPNSDKQWSAVVKNANGVEVRTLSSAIGTLTSEYTSSAQWPYLPQGTYTVDYTYITANGKDMTGSTTFQVTEKPVFSVTTSAGSSYTYYTGDEVTRDVAKANSMTPHQVTGIACTINGIADAILTNSNYTVSVANSFGAGAVANAGGSVVSFADISISTLGENSLSTSATFDGVTKSDDKKFQITGLPFSFNPPTGTNWGSNGSGIVWNEDHARLGNWSGAGSRYIFYNGIKIPAGTKMTLDYKLETRMDNLASSQTSTIVGGNDTWFSYKEDGTGAEPHEAQTTVTASAEITEIRCTNSYGSGQSHTKVYRIGLTYAE